MSQQSDMIAAQDADPVAGGSSTTPVPPGSENIKGIRSAQSAIADAGAIRRNSSGLGNSVGNMSTNAQWQSSNGSPQNAGAAGNDWRLRVSVAPNSGILYNDPHNSMLSPLNSHQGVIFPITPTINVTHTARYGSSPLTHSNYSAQFYEGSEVGEIQINGEFPIQNNAEGMYLLAAIYFFRAATKMFWGTDTLAGTPPPLLYLDGYGSHYFPHVPCVLKSFTHSLPPDVDYIECSASDTSATTRLPTNSQIQISLQPVYSRTKVSKFSTTDFANGKMLGGGFI